jgi:hypothetical protein
MLLAGYAYAHFLSSSLTPRAQAAVHCTLLLVSLMFMPLTFRAAGPGPDDPGVRIWLTLLVSVGFPFAVLASTAPLMQRWASHTLPARSPYRLYALSNAGALLALVTYPLLVEPNLSLRMQTLGWSAGYGIFLLFAFAACRLLWRHSASGRTDPARHDGADPATGANLSPGDAVLTVLLSSGGVVMLLAITSQMTQNVAPIPFLWIMPLVAYLLTYIVCFSGERWYDRAIWGALFIVAGSILIILEFFASSFAILPVIVTYLLVLFCICMVCHGELYRLRPAPQRLGLYYLLIAFGGAAGGALVSIVAPAVFVRYWEGLAGAYLLYAAFGLVVFRDLRRNRKVRNGQPSSGLQALLERWTLRMFTVAWSLGFVLFPAVVMALHGLLPRYDVASSRSFYGVLNVRDVSEDALPRRVLIDGTTIHGFQLLDKDRSLVPTSYYSADTGIGLVLERMGSREDPSRVGIVGLGVGTLAAYGKPADEFRFYELNPAVIDMARQHFSFLRDSFASIDIATGDGRISLEQELRQAGSREFDLLVIDAFSSDAIPVHLLTLEAHRLYWSHLKPGGVLAFHVTNNYLDLAPVVADAGAALGKKAFLITSSVDTGVTSNADWVLLADEPSRLASFGIDVSAIRLHPRQAERVWTDDYSDLLGTIRRQPRLPFRVGPVQQ